MSEDKTCGTCGHCVPQHMPKNINLSERISGRGNDGNICLVYGFVVGGPWCPCGGAEHTPTTDDTFFSANMFLNDGFFVYENKERMYVFEEYDAKAAVRQAFVAGKQAEKERFNEVAEIAKQLWSIAYISVWTREAKDRVMDIKNSLKEQGIDIRMGDSSD